MTAVWYIGTSDSRVISAADWTALGITAATTAWNSGNGYSVPHASLTAGQIAYLGTQPDFNAAAVDGPRTGEVITSAGDTWDPDVAAHAADTLLHSSGQRTGLAINETGTSYTLTTSSVAVTGSSVALPQIPRPQVLEAKVTFKHGGTMTADTTTTAFAVIFDDLGNPLESAGITFTGANSSCWGTAEFSADIEANAPARTYHIEVYRNGSTSGVVVLMNGLISNVNRSRLRARAA